MNQLPEVWLRGPVAGIPGLLQPVAHALLQAKEEIDQIMVAFPDNRLSDRPAGMASVAFHLRHIPGVLDRLQTYAEGKTLSQSQLQYLQGESVSKESTTPELIDNLSVTLSSFLRFLSSLDETTLTQVRTVGRKAFPSTVLGLLFHAAEHTMRHVGQLLVTAAVVRHQENT